MKELKEKIRREVERLGFHLYDLTIGPRGKDKVLSVKIDDEAPVSIDDCVRVSEHLSDLLDELDPFEKSYVLEVTSAGAEHPLRDFEEIRRAKGRFIHVKTAEQEMEGFLTEVTETSITIKDKKGNTTTFFIADIEKIRLAIDF